MGKFRKVYPSDLTEEEWWFVLPYLLLCREDAGQRQHELRDVFDAVRYVARSGYAWRMIPRQSAAMGCGVSAVSALAGLGCFRAPVGDVQSIAREWAGRKGQPSAICIDSRTLQSTPESGARAGYDGAKRRNGRCEQALKQRRHDRLPRRDAVLLADAGDDALAGFDLGWRWAWWSATSELTASSKPARCWASTCSVGRPQA